MYNLEIYSQKGLITPEVLYDIIANKLHFSYNRIEFSKMSKKNLANYTLKDLKLSLAKGKGDLYVDNDNGLEFQTLNFVGHTHKTDGLYFSKEDHRVEEWIYEKIFEQRGFLVAYEKESKFHILQNETSLGNFKAYGLEPPGNLFSYKDKFTPRINIDIRNNPHKDFWDEKNEVNISIGWRMWFSKDFIKIIPQKNIESFNDVYERKWINENVYFMQLFENAGKCANEQNLELAQKFRTWLGIDELLPRHLKYDKDLRQKWDLLVHKYQHSDDARIW